MSKYGAKRTMIDGLNFDSQAEARRYLQLKILQQAGVIANLTIHPVYTIWEGIDPRTKKTERIKYEGDFFYTENGAAVVEDVKGVQTPIFKLKAKMFRVKYYTHELRVVQA